MLPAILSSLALLALPPEDPAGDPADARAALEQLGHPSAEQRRAAQRWLERHLTAADLALVGELLPDLGLEQRARLSAALGSDERHFALAALLCAESDARLSSLGEEALGRLAERWWGDAELAPSDAAAVARALEGHFADRLLLLEVGARSLEVELSALARHFGAPEDLPFAGPIAIALDPPLYARSLEPAPERAGEPLARTPDQLLLALVERHGVALQGFAMDGPRAWLHVVDRARAGASSGAALIAEWCRAVVGGRDEGAARALAATGWPAALEWLGRRWLEQGDVRALSGLLLAAERGRVVPELARPRSVERLLAAADEALARGGPLDARFAEEVGRALGRMDALAGGEEAPADLAARGFDAAPPAAQRLRLGILADLGRMPAELAQLLRRRLSAPEPPPPELALDMLRALAAAAPGTGEPFVWADPVPAFQGEPMPALDLVRDRWLRRARSLPPEAWRDPAVPAARGVGGAEHRARLVAWWLAAEPSAEAAADHLNALAAELEGGAGEARAGDVLARVAARGESESVERLFARAHERGGDGARLDRLALLAGVLAPERAEPLAAALLARDPIPEADLPLLGVLAAEPATERGALARAALIAAAPDGAGADSAWGRALARAFRLLRAAPLARGAELVLEEQLLQGLEREMGESSHPLVDRLRSGAWPRPLGLEPVPLEALELRLGS